jgi:putative ABC transport system permease protein
MSGLRGAAIRWTVGLCRRRGWELLGAAGSVALAVAFLVSLGAFTASSRSSLTVRAANRVAVDWQVQVTAQGTPSAVAASLAHVPGLRASVPVRYARVPALSSVSDTGIRTTGAADVVALGDHYAAVVPREIRFLLGARHGVLLQQQTASNLGARPGSIVVVHTATGSAVPLRVDGVVDLPQADSFFQVVGAPPGAGASAPPDNVVIIPSTGFTQLAAGSEVIRQFHVVLDHHQLPTDPAAAAAAVTTRANRLEASVAGGGLVGDNLATALSGAREDAIYAQLLLLLLGVPGLVLAGVVGVLVTSLRGERRRRETGLVLLRGGSPGIVAALGAGETVLTAAVGITLGLPLGALAVRLALGAGNPVPTSWMVGAALVGTGLAAATGLVPSVRAATRFTTEPVAASIANARNRQLPWPLRAGLDGALLVGAAVAFWLTARSGYKVVLVPEGVPVTSVDYAALLGPALAWPGLILLGWRLTAMAALRRTGRSLPQPAASAPELVAATVRRRRLVIARGSAALAAALGLGVSTAIFTSTYDQQSAVDVALTVGSDVAATPLPGTPAPPSTVAKVAALPGVRSAEPLVHRFVYVGTDLQDLFGIRPATLAGATSLQDSFVPGSTVASVLRAMESKRDGVLLSAETLRDYQLHPGDLIRLRLPVGPNGVYTPVPFHVVGQVSEFPTAPKDSFIVANAAYVNQVTGSDQVSTVLVRTPTPTRTSATLRSALGRGWNLTDIVSGRNSITTASGLAATDLGGLARLELGFALVFALACSALALALGVAERRRALVLLAALGATPRQRRRFLGSEGRMLLAGGLVSGAVAGTVIGYMLVKVLNGIFDPPPDHLVVPGGYVAILGFVVVVVSMTVLAVAGRYAARARPSELRDL